jgi:hypothetical protein
MKNVLLIAGCSHAAGSEIDGTEDSEYNRQHSFGNLVAANQGYEAVNIASGAATNPTINRNVIEWIDTFYNPEEMNLRVLVAWTESTRVEAPSDRLVRHNRIHAAWKPDSDESFNRVNLGYEGFHDAEKILIKMYHQFIAKNLSYFEIISANLILQTQYYLKMKQLDYMMCSTMPMFTNNPHIKHYLHRIDQSRYLHFGNDAEAFFWKYRNAGYINPKAKYWHHDETPHQLFANDIIEKWTSI